VGCLLSRGAKFFKYGHKVAGPGLKEGGKQVSQEVMKLGFQTTVREVIKTSCKEIGKAVAFHVLKQTIETLVHNHLSKFCSDIGETLLSTVNDLTIFVTGLQATLKKVVMTFGKKGAEKLVQEKVQKLLFGGNDFFSDVKTVLSSVTSSVSSGIGNALSKQRMTGKHLELLNISQQVLSFLKEAYDAFNFLKKIKDLLFGHITDLDKELEKECTSKTIQEKQISDQEIGAFQLKAVGDIKSALGQKAGQMIEEWTAQMLNKAAVCAIKVVSKKAKRMYQNQRENKEIQKLRQSIVKERERKLNEILSGNTDPEALEPSKAHIEECMKIMKKTKSAKVFAEIVREGVPTDRFCAQALEEALPTVLSSFNIPTIKIRVETSDGELVHETSSNDANVKVINLKLERSANDHLGHYRSEEGGSVGGNNCMFEATANELRRLYPDADIPDPATLREMTATRIESSPALRHAIESGWHQYTLNKNMYGGAPLGQGTPAMSGLYKHNKQFSEKNKFEQDHQPAVSHIHKYAKDEGVRKISSLEMPVLSISKENHQKTKNYKGKAHSTVNNDHGLFHEMQKKYLSEGQYAEAIWHAVKENWIPIVKEEQNADLKRQYCESTKSHFELWSQVQWTDKTNKKRTFITKDESKILTKRFDMKIAKINVERLYNAAYD
jgi:hypothetical protein